MCAGLGVSALTAASATQFWIKQKIMDGQNYTIHKPFTAENQGSALGKYMLPVAHVSTENKDVHRAMISQSQSEH